MNDIISFLTSEFERGNSYSSVNIARSALSSLGLKLENFSAGTHPLVIRFMKGVFNLRPPKARYSHIWDVDIVLKYLRKLSPVKLLSLKDLTLKLAMLLALTNASRIHSVHMLTVNGLQKLKSEYVIQFGTLEKHARPGSFSSFLRLKAYPPDRRLCVYFVIKEYLRRTNKLRDRQDNNLLISYIRPHRAVSKDTVARWIKIVMLRAGVNTEVFGAHSVRAASTSKAKANAVPIQDIMRTAGWSRESTFTKFYNKKITKEGFAEAVLKL